MSTILNPYILRYLLHKELYYTQRGGFMDYLEWFYQRISELRIQKGVSARDMSLSLGQSESYINKIENKRTLPSMTGFFYICDYLNITPQEFFNTDATAPQKSKELLREIERLTPEQTDHIMLVIRDLIRCQ